MLLFRLLLPVLANAIPSFAVEPKKFKTVISEDSYKHDVISTQRAVQAETECTDYPPDWAADYYYDLFSHWMKLDCDKYKWFIDRGPPSDYYYTCIYGGWMTDLTDEDNGLRARDACCVCGGGKTGWFISYVESLLSDNTLTSTYYTKAGVGTDYITKFTDGECAPEGTLHDGSVFTTTHGTNDADDTLFITKTINAAAIANQHGGSFVFCETVALTDTGISQTYEVVYAKTQYTITATFLAEINSYSVTLQDDTIITQQSEDLSLTGTVVVTRCGDVSENLNPGDELCLEISETSSNDIGVESINNLNFIQDVATFTAITDGVTQHIDLVSEDCANVPGTCTVKITVPSFMYEGSSGSDTVTMDVSGKVYLYDTSSKNGKAEINSFSFSVKLEKPCEGGLLGSIAKMFSK